MQLARNCGSGQYAVAEAYLHALQHFLSGNSPAAVASVLGALRRRSFERPFKYKKEERLNTLISLDRDGQFLSENGQFVVANGQKTVAKLAE
jgi:hypothetical protein